MGFSGHSLWIMSQNPCFTTMGSTFVFKITFLPQWQRSWDLAFGEYYSISHRRFSGTLSFWCSFRILVFLAVPGLHVPPSKQVTSFLPRSWWFFRWSTWHDQKCNYVQPLLLSPNTYFVDSSSPCSFHSESLSWHNSIYSGRWRLRDNSCWQQSRQDPAQHAHGSEWAWIGVCCHLHCKALWRFFQVAPRVVPYNKRHTQTFVDSGTPPWHLTSSSHSWPP